jgi:hypothetical protein
MSDDRPPLPPALMSGLPSLLASADTGPVRERVKDGWEVLYLRLENLERRTAERDVLFSRVEKLEQRIAELETKRTP